MPHHITHLILQTLPPSELKTIFCHLFVNWIKILFTSYHCYHGSPLSCKAHQNFDVWSCHPTLRELH